MEQKIKKLLEKKKELIELQEEGEQLLNMVDSALTVLQETKIKQPSRKQKILKLMYSLTKSKIPLCGMYYNNETKDIVINIRNVLAGSQLKRLEELITSQDFKFLINFETKKIKIFEKDEK